MLAGGRGSGAGKPGSGSGLPGLSGGDGSLEAPPSPGTARVGDELPRRLVRLGPLPIDDMFCGRTHQWESLYCILSRSLTVDQSLFGCSRAL